MITENTIFALGSGAGKSGVAVIRISDVDLFSDFQKIIGTGKTVVPRSAKFVNLIDLSGALIDRCIAIYFKGPASFTGEDVIEIHCHGAPSVISKIFEHLSKLGARLAHPGEFSRRAFYNEKMDLTEIDGLVSLLNAQTDKQRISALNSMTGIDGNFYESWRLQMIEIAAFGTAILDYPSDELPKNIGVNLCESVIRLRNEISDTISGYASVRAVRTGFNIVLTGATNVGKSSIFNRAVGANRAIVSNIHGTTRDVISTSLDIDGYLVNLSDTAGLRKTKDKIEKIGINKTTDALNNADLVLRVFDDENLLPTKKSDNEILIVNKCDDEKINRKNSGAIFISAKTGFGIPALLSLIKEKIHTNLDGKESEIAVNARTLAHLENAKSELDLALCNAHLGWEIFAEHVRTASDSFGRILGVIDADEIADKIFGQLCLGK